MCTSVLAAILLALPAMGQQQCGEVRALSTRNGDYAYADSPTFVASGSDLILLGSPFPVYSKAGVRVAPFSTQASRVPRSPSDLAIGAVVRNSRITFIQAPRWLLSPMQWPQGVADKRGRVHVVWGSSARERMGDTAADYTTRSLWYAVLENGRWSDPALITARPGLQWNSTTASPLLLVGDTILIVISTGVTAEGPLLLSSGQGAWSVTPMRLSPFMSGYPRLAFLDKTVWLTYQSAGTTAEGRSVSALFVTSRTGDASEWKPGERVSAGGEPAYEPSLFATPRSLVLTWWHPAARPGGVLSQPDSTAADTVHTAIFTSTSGWTRQRPLVLNGGTRRLAAAISAAGTLYVATSSPHTRMPMVSVIRSSVRSRVITGNSDAVFADPRVGRLPSGEGVAVVWGKWMADRTPVSMLAEVRLNCF